MRLQKRKESRPVKFVAAMRGIGSGRRHSFMSFAGGQTRELAVAAIPRMNLSRWPKYEFIIAPMVGGYMDSRSAVERWTVNGTNPGCDLVAPTIDPGVSDERRNAIDNRSPITNAPTISYDI